MLRDPRCRSHFARHLAPETGEDVASRAATRDVLPAFKAEAFRLAIRPPAAEAYRARRFGVSDGVAVAESVHRSARETLRKWQDRHLPAVVIDAGDTSLGCHGRSSSKFAVRTTVPGPRSFVSGALSGC